MAEKPAGAVPHQGGVVTQPGEPSYELIRRWIAQGVRFDPDAPSRRAELWRNGQWQEGPLTGLELRELIDATSITLEEVEEMGARAD